MKLKEYPRSLLHIASLKFTKLPNPHLSNSETADVIVSCTSIASRLSVVHLTVKSVLSQKPAPKKMVLWLNNRIKDRTPKKLLKLQSNRFEIRYTELDSPHCKLVPSLKEFPNETVITCDDDLLYEQGWLKNIINSHIKNPEAIIAYRVRKMAHEPSGKIKPYREWKYDWNCQNYDARHIGMGYGGILYPPHSLFPDVIKEDIYSKLCPKADDLWFKAMGYLNKTPTLRISEESRMNPIPRSQAISLKSSNVKGDQNRVQWEALCEYYPKLLDISQK